MSILSFNLYAYHRNARQKSPLHATGSQLMKANFHWALIMFLVPYKVLYRVVSQEPWGEHYYLPNSTDEQIES